MRKINFERGMLAGFGAVLTAGVATLVALGFREGSSGAEWAAAFMFAGYGAMMFYLAKKGNNQAPRGFTR